MNMKKAFALFLSVIILAALPFSAAFAEDYTSSGWTATFNGKQIDSNFKSNTISTEISKIQPGDSMTISVTIKNTYSGDSEWYMTNEVLKSLEDSKKSASGGAYDYELTYKGPSESKTFFSSTGIGGENGDIKEATGTLKDYFYVGTLKTGQTGTVTLKVTIDGEADGNSYMNSLAQFQMKFAVEKAATGGTTVVEYSPKTGEIINITLWLVVFLASVAIIVAIVKAKKKARKETARK